MKPQLITKNHKPTIRNATEQDISTILGLWRDVVEPNIVPWKVGELFKSSKSNWFVVDNSNIPYVPNVVGFVAARIENGVGHISGLAIKPEFGGSGLGGELIKAIEKHLRENNINELTVHVRKSNNKAQRFYEKNNFVRVAELEDYYPDDNENGFVYSKQL